MKNIIEYYYNIKINNLYTKEDTYYFINNNHTYILKPFIEDISKLPLIYQTNQILSTNTILDTIIPNINKSPITNINNKNYILVNKKINIPLNINNINYLSKINIKEINTNLERNNWELLWGEIIDYYEKQIGENQKKYPILRESLDYYIGLAENAISYITNTKQTEKKEINDTKVLSHNTLDKSLTEPENIILDHKSRDIAEYIKQSFYTQNQNIYQELEDYFKYNYYSKYAMQILFGRILYPTEYLNTYDKIIKGELKEEEITKITSQNKKYELYIYNINSYLKKYYDIPLPEWLNPH